MLFTFLGWRLHAGGLQLIGHAGAGFAFDNEGPRHAVYLRAFRVADRPVTNGEYREFMAAGGYDDASAWLSEGWRTVQERGWQAPLYWERRDGAWWTQTLSGPLPLDPHGVIRVPQYAGAIRAGHVNPKSPIAVVAETPVIARLDGGRGFGQVVARRGMEMAIAKAKANGLSAVTLANTTHVGRLADYAEMAAAEGLVGMLWVNAVFGLNVAPWGGAARRLGTNPHAIAVPGEGGPSMVLDFATSVVAEGKIRVKKNRKQQAPPGWFIDAQGRPGTDPEVFYGTPPGSLLTAGEHKGYGLSLAVEILGGILSGTGAAGPGTGVFANGTLMICLDVDRFIPLAEFRKQMADFVAWVKSAPLVPGVGEILIPGEPEARLEAERRRDGIPIEDETWRQIEALAAELGVG